ncbi:MAG: hypothetical protein Fur0041_11810 [Bacteroidia bacterium]
MSNKTEPVQHLRIAFYLFFFFLFSISASAQTLVADAGVSTQICPGTSYNIGGTPTAIGGTAPYSYFWSPNVNISSLTASNPTVNPAVPTMYYLMIIDFAGDTAYDSVYVGIDPIYQYNAGNDTSICIGGTATLGGSANSFAGGITYLWAPSTGLSSTSAPRPVCSATVTTTYTVTITSPNCPSKQYNVTVTVNPLPIVTASADVTIDEGQTAVLTASGATDYAWFPATGLSNTTGALTNAEPTVSTTYYVFGTDANGCQNYDSVVVTVIPNSEIIIYNSFSPNNDGINDVFYIGNIYKYPQCRLEIYTRTGQPVYSKTGYQNDWDGTNYGDRLPEATYYFSLDLGDGSAPILGNVTILR